MSDLTGYNAPCVHRMPCGLCAITKKACCTYYSNGMTITPTPVPVPYKIEPNWNEVTCSAKMAGKEQKSYADWELRRE